MKNSPNRAGRTEAAEGKAELSGEVARRASVFICHKRDVRRDDRLAGKLAEALKPLCDVYLDLKAPPGEDWQRRLEEELGKADFFIVLLSEHAQRSAWVMTELTYADYYRRRRGRPAIIPVRLRYKQRLYTPAIQALVGSLQEIEWRNDSDLIERLSEVILNDKPVKPRRRRARRRKLLWLAPIIITAAAAIAHALLSIFSAKPLPDEGLRQQPAPVHTPPSPTPKAPGPTSKSSPTSAAMPTPGPTAAPAEGVSPVPSDLLEKIARAHGLLRTGNRVDKEKALQLYREVEARLPDRTRRRLDPKLLKSARDSYAKRFLTDNAVNDYDQLLSPLLAER